MGGNDGRGLELQEIGPGIGAIEQANPVFTGLGLMYRPRLTVDYGDVSEEFWSYGRSSVYCSAPGIGNQRAVSGFGKLGGRTGIGGAKNGSRITQGCGWQNCVRRDCCRRNNRQTGIGCQSAHRCIAGYIGPQRGGDVQNWHIRDSKTAIGKKFALLQGNRYFKCFIGACYKLG